MLGAHNFNGMAVKKKWAHKRLCDSCGSDASVRRWRIEADGPRKQVGFYACAECSASIPLDRWLNSFAPNGRDLMIVHSESFIARAAQRPETRA